jgi:hypothetical protein
MIGFALFWSWMIVVGAAFGAWTYICFRRPPRVALPVPADHRHYCRDCRWCIPGPSAVLLRRQDYGRARCAHITSVREPAEILVHGRLTEDNMQMCSIVRRAPYEVTGMVLQFLAPPAGTTVGLCGPEAKYWEPRA